MNHNLTKYLLRLDLEGNYKPNVAIHGIVKLNNCSPAGSTEKTNSPKAELEQKRPQARLKVFFCGRTVSIADRLGVRVDPREGGGTPTIPHISTEDQLEDRVLKAQLLNSFLSGSKGKTSLPRLKSFRRGSEVIPALSTPRTSSRIEF